VCRNNKQERIATLKKNKVFLQKAKKQEKEREAKSKKNNRRKTHENRKKKAEEFRIFFCAFSATCATMNFAVKNGSSLRKNRT